MTDTDKTAAPETAIAEQKAVTWLDRIGQMKIVNVETYLLMGDMLKEVKRVVNLLEDETRPEIDQAYKLHKALMARKKKWADKFEEAERLAKEKIKHFDESYDGQLPAIEGVTLSESWSGEVIDAALIPKEYLTPDLVKLNGVTKSLKEATSIPGWKAKSGKTVSVRL